MHRILHMSVVSVCLAMLLAITALCAPARAEHATIRFGILPVLDTLPLQVAARQGLFAEHGLNVELVPFSSALERDTAMQAGRLDGFFGDLVPTFLLLDAGVPLRIALVSWRSTPGYPMFAVLTSPQNAGASVKQLKGRTLGISTATIIEYLLDAMEAEQGLEAPFKRVEIKKIPIRLQMLLSGQLDMALLPEPLVSLTRDKGGAVLMTDENLDIPVTVLCLSDRFFEGDAAAYAGFVAAWHDAVKLLRTDPEAWRGLMAETCRIPPPLAEDFPIYPYPDPSLPSVAELEDVQD